MAWTAALLLAGYFAFALYALLSPSAGDPQSGMANGFSCLAITVFVSLEAMLWFGVTRKRPGIVRTVFVIAVLPLLAPIARLVYLLVRAVSGSGR